MKFGFIANHQKIKEISTFYDELIQWLEKNKVSYFFEEQFAKLLEFRQPIPLYPFSELVEKADIIVTLGGDGTILSTAREIGFLEKPILGFHLGNLGFLAELTRKTYQEKLKNVLNGDYVLDKRMVIQAKICFSGETLIYHALNDIVISKGTFPRMIRYTVEVEAELINRYYADGLIVATPTGSTAYNLSANGPILMPDIDAFVINPICPHSLTNRPVVLSANRTLTIRFTDVDEGTHITADGQVFKPVTPDCVVQICKAPFTVQLVRQKDSSYFQVLRSKLLWGSQ
ncbi:MAG TPA: NAD(+)/NADH kinase [Candidatus Marinimicrobia bacterium]|nr:NAD(+)/NADH kinase [Candidatus Neomarinimicrobiota bacterium]